MKASCDEEAHAFVIAVCHASSALKHGRSTRDGGDGFRRACVAWGVESFERAFKREPENLLRANPPESRTANGASFWSGTKRLPNALAFDATDARHATFVVAHAMLFSSLFSVTEVRSNDDDEDAEQFEPEGKDALNAGAFLETLRRMTRNREEKTKKSGADDAETRRGDDEGTGDRTLKDADAEASSADRLAQATLDAFEDGRNVKAFRLSPSTPFDGPRRDPTRAAFVAAAAACRAVVFGVPVPRERELAAAATGSRPGTPAPAALAAALAAVETYKLAASTAAKSSSLPFPRDSGADETSAAARNLSDFRLDEKPLEACSSAAYAFRCSYGSLGGHAHVSASPAALETKTAKTSRGDLRFTAWDAFVFDARDGATLSSFLEKFRATVGLEPSTVARGASLLFADFMNLAKPETAARMNTPLKTLFEDVLDEGSDEERTKSAPKRVLVSVTACDENDDDVEIPEVWVRIR